MNGKEEWKPNTNVLVSKGSEKQGNDEGNQLHTFFTVFYLYFCMERKHI